jgi:branched-chain amino acid transport system substrate-binding protein
LRTPDRSSPLFLASASTRLPTRARGLVRGAVLLATLLCAAGCSRPVLVGVVVSDTGAAAPYGEKVRRGLEVALDDLRAAGGVGARIRLLYRDDATNPDVGAQVTRELIEKEGVRLVIGAVSSPVTLRIAPLCQSRRTILLSPTSSSPAITAAGDWIYRNYPSDTLEGTSLADFARDLGFRRVAVLAVQNEFGAGLSKVFAERFEGDTRRVIRSLAYREGDVETFGVLAEQLRLLSPDGVYVAGYADDTAGILRALRDAGVRAVVLGTSSMTAEAVRRAGPAAEGFVFPETSFDPQSLRPAARRFVAAYRARFHEDPDGFAAHAHDALKLLAVAMEREGSADPESVRRGLNAIEDYPGAAGPVAFDENGDVVQYPRLFIVNHGHAEPYDRFIEGGGTLPVPAAN